MKRIYPLIFITLILFSCKQAHESKKESVLLQVGKMAPDFTAADQLGKYHKLSDYKGKYILIDFWASWCRPCRANNKEILQLYSEFPKNKFEILSISVDDNVAAWENAISEDGLKNTQLFDKKSDATPASVLYQVDYIPSTFLIDPTGNLLSIRPEISEVKRSLKELL